ncbi:MAG: GTPase, partial [Candidatus Omnitrophota bacterium]
NAGKSSLFNLLTHSDVLVRDKLFATLDTTTRMLTVNPNQKALLADTVGFIRDLPHDLVEAFKATLEETMHADLLIHVVDAAAEDYRVKEQAVEQVLEQLGAGSKPTLKVYNKTDLLTDAAKATLSTFERGLGVYFISVLKRQGIEELLEGISERFAGEWIRWDILVPASKQNLINYLYEKALVLARRDEADGSHLSVSIRPQDKRVIESKLQG